MPRKQKQKKGDASAAPRGPEPGLGVMEDIYNALMLRIEPELTTSVLPFLDLWYEGETEEERRERGARYARAYEEYQRQFAVLVVQWKEEILQFKKQALAGAKREAAQMDARKLQEIERSLGDA